MAGVVLGEGLCFICCMPGGRWTITKRQLPSYVCSFCKTRMFVNTQAALDALGVWIEALPQHKDKILQKALDRAKTVAVPFPVPAALKQEVKSDEPRNVEDTRATAESA